MDAKERYALIKLAREQFELGQKILAQADCKLAINTDSGAGAIDIIPCDANFKHIDELDDADKETARDAEDFLAESPVGLDVDAYFGNGETYFMDIPEWWAGIIEVQREEAKQLLGVVN